MQSLKESILSSTRTGKHGVAFAFKTKRFRYNGSPSSCKTIIDAICDFYRIKDYHEKEEVEHAVASLYDLFSDYDIEVVLDHDAMQILKDTLKNFPEYKIENIDYIPELTEGPPFIVKVTGRNAYPDKEAYYIWNCGHKSDLFGEYTKKWLRIIKYY